MVYNAVVLQKKVRDVVELPPMQMEDVTSINDYKNSVKNSLT